MAELKMRRLGDPFSRRTAQKIVFEKNFNTVGLAEYVAAAKLQANAFVTSNPYLATIASGYVPIAKLSNLIEL